MKTQAEIYQALLDGKKIRCIGWNKAFFIQLKNGNLYNQEGFSTSYSFESPEDWKIVEPEREKIALYQSINNQGNLILVDKNGRPLNFNDSRNFLNSCPYEHLKSRIISDTPFCYTWKDTFEIVREENKGE